MRQIFGNILNFRNLTGLVLIVTASVTIVSGCAGRGGAKAGGASGESSSKASAKAVCEVRAFPQVNIPAMIEDNDERGEYAALHWFDQFAKIEDRSGAGKQSGNGASGNASAPTRYLCDSTHVAGVPSDQLEQMFATWCGLLDMVPMETAERASEHLFDRIAACEAADTSSNIFERMNGIVDKYLYDPNSPMRNEDYYRPFVQARSQCALVSPERREADARTAKNCALNKVGTKAADFIFSDRNGRTYTLYGIKAETTLLFFSNPGCNACKSIIDNLKSYPEMETMISSGELAVLNIYIDEDLAEWYKYMPIYPTSWYNGYDPNYAIRSDVLYDVRAIPSLYLLGRDKTVLMKDAPAERVLPAIFGH